MLVAIFIIGYLTITLESPLGLSKAATALLTGILCWLVYINGMADPRIAEQNLYHHFGEISSILFFLLGAMTIVELIDIHGGFTMVRTWVKTKSKSRLLAMVAAIAFFLSAFLDNLTTTIVMASFTSKLLQSRQDRLWFASMIVIAANAGGVFSPLGDVTTTMLWIGGQITAVNTVRALFIPSVVVCLVPLVIISWRFRKQVVEASFSPQTTVPSFDAHIVLFTGVALLLLVPFFHGLTHLPPFMGILFAVGILWIVTTRLHSRKDVSEKTRLSVSNALQRIDTPSILFFLGILLSVAALQSAGILENFGRLLTSELHDDRLIGITLGLVSAVIDNVPLVAAAQGMYGLDVYPTDSSFWQFLALTTGTGGSAIIIGSAAGVAAMGIERIEFGWYLKRISWIALVGFALGALVFIGLS